MEASAIGDCHLRPFLAAPNADRYFPATAIEAARCRISRAIERGEGPALVIGASGMGKSLLFEVLTRQFAETFEVVHLASAQLCTRRALLQSILFELNLPYRDADEGELRISLVDYLKPRLGHAHRLLLLVDEAESLATRLLEELRALANLSADGQLLVNLVLAGNATLEERFAEPELDAFSQRIAHRCYLCPFSREEAFQYVRAQMVAAGLDPKLFSEHALEALFSATDGVPRLVNQLGDQLVWHASEAEVKQLDAAAVQQTWSNLQQLPAPWDLRTREVESSAVEFGELSVDSGSVEVAENEEELPALIPISGCQSALADSDGVESTASLAETERLVTQYQDQNFTNTARVAEWPGCVGRNPFDEVFEEEEVIFDQYHGCETQLLSGTQRVTNQLDVGFAEQLKGLEAPPERCDSGAADAVAEEEDIASQDFAHTVHIESCPEADDDLPAGGDEIDAGIEVETDFDEALVDCVALARDENEESIGEVLIVEDDGPASIAIVPGKHFRQLFSSLETGTAPHRYG